MNDDAAHALATILGIVLWVGATFGPGIYVLGPLDRAARKRCAAVQFTLLDFFALTAHLSVPMAFIGQFSTRAGGRGVEVILVGFGCVSACSIWWGTVRTAARAGIAQPLKRFLMIAIVVPITFVAAFSFGMLLPYVVCRPIADRSWPDWWTYLLVVSLPLVFVGLRWCVNWILRTEELSAEDLETQPLETASETF